MASKISQLKTLLGEIMADRHEITIAERRSGVDAIAEIGSKLSGVSVKWSVLGGVRVAIFSNEDSPWDSGNSSEFIIHVHGGAFVAGSPKSHIALCSMLHDETDIPIISIDYRLSPENPHPHAVMDLIAVIEDCVGSGDQSVSYSVVGDSAGATIALLAMCQLRTKDKLLPRSLVFISPLYDLLCRADSYEDRKDLDPFISRKGLLQDISAYIGNAGLAAEDVMQEYGNLEGLPPVLVQVGTDEVLLNDAIAFREEAERQGVSVQLEIWPEMTHVWHLFPAFLEQARRAVINISVFIKR